MKYLGHGIAIVLSMVCGAVIGVTDSTLTQTQIDQQLTKIVTDFTQKYQQLDTELTQTTTNFFAYLDVQKTAVENSALSQSDKDTVESLIQTASTAVTSAYTTQSQSLDSQYTTAYNKLVQLKDAKAQTVTSDFSLLNVKTQLTTFVDSVSFPQLSNLNVVLSDQRRKIGDSAGIKLAAQQLVQRQAYQQQMQKLWRDLQPLVTQFSSIQNSARSLEMGYITSKTFDTQGLNQIVSTTKTLISQLIQLYQNYNVSIVPGDTANVALSAANFLINMFIDDMNIVSSNVTRETSILNTKQQGFTRLYGLAERIVGSQKSEDSPILSKGYNATVQEINTLFPDDVKLSLQATYTTQRKRAIQSTMINELQDILLTYSAPTAQQVTYGQAFFDVAILDVGADEQTVAQQLYGNIALLHVARATGILSNLLPGQDNVDAVTDAANNFTQASQQFTRSGDVASANQYSSLATNLSGALTQLSQAQRAAARGSIQNAITYYKQASGYFSRGGDQSDAAYAQFQWQTLQAQSLQTQGQTTLANALALQRITLQNYVQSLSTVTPPWSLSASTSYTRAWRAVRDAVQQVIGVYGEASRNLESIMVSAQLAAGTNYQEQKRAVDDAVTFLTTFSRMWDVVDQADVFARQATLEAVNLSEQRYDQALDLARMLDDVYQSDTAVAALVPLYVTDIMQGVSEGNLTLQSGQQWTYYMLISRHLAKNYVDIMNTQTVDPVIQAQYFVDAGAGRSDILSSAVETYLTTTLNAIRDFWGNIEQVYFYAQAREATALTYSADLWNNSGTDEKYTSSAVNGWEQVLRLYKTGIMLGAPGPNVPYVNMSKSGYIKAAGEFAQRYLDNVPQQFFPSSGAAMIYYRHYIACQLALVSDENQAVKVTPNAGSMATEALANVTRLAKQFLTQGSDLIAQTQQTSLLTTVTESQVRLIEWKDYFKEMVRQQEEILNQLIPKDQQTQYRFLAYEVDNDGNISCTWLPDKTTVRLTNPDKALGDLYKQIADKALQDDDYTTAYTSYYKAWDFYSRARRTSEAQQAFDNYVVTRVKNTAATYQYYVLPNEKDQANIGTIQAYSLTVPSAYQLKYYAVTVSTYLPLPGNLELLATTTSVEGLAAVRNDLVGIAALVFTDKKLNTLGLSYRDVFDGLNIRSPLPSKISSDTVQAILNDADVFKQALTTRLTNNTSKLVLYQSGGVYKLLQSNVPILAVQPPQVSADIALKSLSYTGFPTAELYYKAAQTFYAPGASRLALDGTSVTVASQDQDEAAAQAIDLLWGQAYVKDAADYTAITKYITIGEAQAAVNAIPGLTDVSFITTIRQSYAQVLKITNTGDTSKKMSDYTVTYQALKSYYLDIIYFQLLNARKHFLSAQNTQAVATLQNQTGDMLIGAARALKPFLFGDPTAEDFYSALKDQTDVIKMALVTYPQGSGKEAELYGYLVPLSRSAGDNLMAQGKPATATSFYINAAALYKQVPQSQRAAIQRDITATNIALVRSMLLSAAVNAVTYFTAKQQGVTIKQTDGSTKTVTLQQLVQDYQQSGLSTAVSALYGQGMDANELKAYQDTRKALLDAMIYAVSTSQQAATLMSAGDTQAIRTQAAELISTYTTNNNIDTTTKDGLTRFLDASKLKDTIMGAFESFAQAIQSSSSVQTQDANWAAISTWTTNLMSLFFGTYTNDILGGTTGSVEQFSEQFQAEVQEILAPSSSYI